MNCKNKVYAIDDDQAVLLSLEALLTQHGYSVACFPSAEQFLAEVDLHRPGCVITDLRMPGMSGADLVERLSCAGSPLSVAILTGMADFATVAALFERHSVSLLEKPYDAASLLRVVESGLAASIRRSALAS